MQVDYQGVTYKSIQQLAKALELPPPSLRYYVQKTENIDTAVEQCRLSMNREPLILWGNPYNSLADISLAFGISYSSLENRFKDQKSLQEVVWDLLTAEPIEFEGRQYATITELCAAYGLQNATVFIRLRRGMHLEEAIKRPVRMLSGGDSVLYEGVEYPSKISLCREYGISLFLVYHNMNYGKTDFLGAFQLLHQLKEKAGLSKADQINSIPSCIIRGKQYLSKSKLANELKISPAVIKAYKSNHSYSNIFCALKAMQSEQKGVCQLGEETVIWEELRRRGYTKSQMDQLKRTNQIFIPVYPQLQGIDFDTGCVDTLELYNQLREELQSRLNEEQREFTEMEEEKPLFCCLYEKMEETKLRIKVYDQKRNDIIKYDYGPKMEL